MCQFFVVVKFFLYIYYSIVILRICNVVCVSTVSVRKHCTAEVLYKLIIKMSTIIIIVRQLWILYFLLFFFLFSLCYFVFWLCTTIDYFCCIGSLLYYYYYIFFLFGSTLVFRLLYALYIFILVPKSFFYIN